MNHLSGGSSLLSTGNSHSFKSGIIALQDGPMMISSQPILPSNGEGLARGTLLFGRYLNEAAVGEIAQVTLFPVTVCPVLNPGCPDFEEAFASFSEGSSTLVKPVNSQQVMGYALMNDIYGEPALILRVELPRDTFTLGQNAITVFILSVLGGGLIVGAFTMLLIQTQVLSRFTRLTQGIDGITESGSAATRISIGGSDELTMVAGTINECWPAIEEAGGEVRNSERRYRLLAENVSDVIFVLNEDLIFTFVTPSVTQLTGYSPEEIISNGIDNIMPRNDLNRAIEDMVREGAGENSEGSDIGNIPALESQLIRKDGTTVWAEIRISSIRDGDGRLTGFTGVARDVSARRKAADALQVQYEQERNLRQQLELEIQKRIEFTRALVHELKTPITPVLAAVELLLDEITDERLTRLVQNIDRSASNLNQRIDALLDLARGEIDALRLELETRQSVTIYMRDSQRDDTVAEHYGRV
jgi:PAS domain S-box-containing protein